MDCSQCCHYALCVVSWDVVTAASQAVNEVWEPEAHSQLEWGEEGPGHWQVLLSLSLTLGSLPMRCLLAMWTAPGPWDLWMESVQTLVLSGVDWRLAVTARLGLASTGHWFIRVSLSSWSFGKPGNHPLPEVEWCLIVCSFCFSWLNLCLQVKILLAPSSVFEGFLEAHIPGSEESQAICYFP